METRQFTKSQVSSIMYNESCAGYIVVCEEIIDNDIEKASITKSITIEETSTGKFFNGHLGESQWGRQDEYNAKVIWEQVVPYTVSITKYRRPNKQDIRDMKIDEVIK